MLVFRDGDELLLQSRDEKPLDRYFPELRAALLAQLPPRCVLDGELVIARDGALDFEALQMRLHPAASRVAKLAAEIPTSIVFFDLLCEGERDLRARPFRERRAALEALLARANPPLHVTPATVDRAIALDWFQRFEGAGLDGVMAKPDTGTYQPNKRVMLKVKHERECDCVVAGFRWHKNGEGTALGSLLLGLYDDAGALQHVGVASSFTDAKRRELIAFLAPYRDNALASHPWKDWAGHEAEAAHAAPAGRRQPLERGQESRLGAAAPGARGRGRLRPHAGHPLPAHRAVPALADGQEAERLHLRAARGRAAARAGGDLRKARRPFRASTLRATPESDRRRGRASPAAGRSASGTFFRFTRIRVQVDERPRIESTSTSSTASRAATSG